MQQWLKDYFSFTSSQRKGIIAMLVLLILFVLGTQLYMHTQTPQPIDTSEFYSEAEQFIAIQEQADKKKLKKIDYQKTIATNQGQVEYFDFDPNHTSREDWIRLGLKDWQVSAIEKYLKKGGIFKDKSGFRKMHVIKDKDFEKLAPYIQIGNKEAGLVVVPEEPKQSIVELNTADAEMLKALPGIGPVLSNRIIEYRGRLGGYLVKEQLFEVFGLDSAVIQNCYDHIRVSDTLMERININICPVSVLGNHPYVPLNVARAIVNYRDQHGPYKEILEIRKTDLVNDDLYRKIAPYFSID